MKILVFGAGVLGCGSGEKFLPCRKGRDPAGPGELGEKIRRDGLRIKDKFVPRVSVSHVPVVNGLRPDDRYDVIFVVMRYTQIGSILDALRARSDAEHRLCGQRCVRKGGRRRAAGEKRALCLCILGRTPGGGPGGIHRPEKDHHPPLSRGVRAAGGLRLLQNGRRV